MTDPRVIPIRVQPWTRGGVSTVYLLGTGEAGQPRFEQWLCPFELIVEQGVRLNGLECVSKVGFLTCVGRPMTPGERFEYVERSSTGGRGVVTLTARQSLRVTGSAATRSDDTLSRGQNLPFCGREPNSVQPEAVVSFIAHEPLRQDGQEAGTQLDQPNDISGLQTGLVLALGGFGDAMTPVLVLPELGKFLERNTNFRWHGDSGVLGASCLPPIDSGRSEAPLFYSVPPERASQETACR